MPDTEWAHPSAMLRAVLTEDEAEFGRLAAEVEGDSAADTFGLLVAAAYVLALRCHFRDGYTAADVIRLVAKLRSYSAEAAEAIDPVGAELVIKAALGAPSDPDAADDATKANTEAAILMLLVADQQLSDEELDGFIADAVAQARKAR